MRFGNIEVPGPLAVTAYAGAHGRVFAKNVDALADVATTIMAKAWLAKADDGMPAFNAILEMIGKNPDLFEAAVAFVRWRATT